MSRMDTNERRILFLFVSVRVIRGKTLLPASFEQPGIRGKVFDRLSRALLDAQLRFPPDRADSFRVEEDERAVADPPAVAAGVRQLGFHAHLRAAPADGVVALTVFIRAQIVD